MRSGGQRPARRENVAADDYRSARSLPMTHWCALSRVCESKLAMVARHATSNHHAVDRSRLYRGRSMIRRQATSPCGRADDIARPWRRWAKCCASPTLAIVSASRADHISDHARLSLSGSPASSASVTTPIGHVPHDTLGGLRPAASTRRARPRKSRSSRRRYRRSSRVQRGFEQAGAAEPERRALFRVDTWNLRSRGLSRSLKKPAVCTRRQASSHYATTATARALRFAARTSTTPDTHATSRLAKRARVASPSPKRTMARSRHALNLPSAFRSSHQQAAIVGARSAPRNRGRCRGLSVRRLARVARPSLSSSINQQCFAALQICCRVRF